MAAATSSLVDDEPAFGGVVASGDYRVAHVAETQNPWGAACRRGDTQWCAARHGLSAAIADGSLAEEWRRWSATRPCRRHTAHMMKPVDTLRRLVELESPTGDPARIAHIGEFISAELASLGGACTTTASWSAASFGPKDAGKAGLLLLAHLDTAGPRGGSRDAVRVDGDMAHGPGALDMKGGIVVMLEALRRGMPLGRPVSVLVTADEEFGSPAGGRTSRSSRAEPRPRSCSSRRCRTARSLRSGRVWPAISC